MCSVYPAAAGPCTRSGLALLHPAPPALAAGLALSLGLALVPAPVRAQGPAQRPDGALATVTQGQGTPVVIVTGVLGSAYGFRKVIPALVADHRVTVVDPLGFGASPRPDGADYSSGAQANRVARVIERLGGGPVILVCHALAGPICLRLAYHRPDLVRGVVSINGGASEQAGTLEMRMALRFARIVLFIAGRKFAIHKVKDGLIGSSGDPSWVTDEVVAQYVAPFGSDVGQVVRAMQQIVGAHETESLRPALPQIRAPMLLLFGPINRDPKSISLSAEERVLLRSGLRKFEEIDVPGAGQYIQEEQAARVVAAIERMQAQTR
jgi:pimeloyl-ACP methyl ester carboxylesterase